MKCKKKRSRRCDAPHAARIPKFGFSALPIGQRISESKPRHQNYAVTNKCNVVPSRNLEASSDASEIRCASQVSYMPQLNPTSSPNSVTERCSSAPSARNDESISRLAEHAVPYYYRWSVGPLSQINFLLNHLRLCTHIPLSKLNNFGARGTGMLFRDRRGSSRSSNPQGLILFYFFLFLAIFLDVPSTSCTL